MLMSTQRESTPEAVSINPKPTEKQIQSLLNKLLRVWRTHLRDGILARYEIGRLLNDSLGSPATRHKYGTGVVSRAAKQLEISRSEIYRMRNFAHVVTDVKKFLSDMPQMKSWTCVKGHLGNTSKTDGQKDSGDKAAYAVAGVRRSIRSFVKRVQEWESIPEDSRRGLRDELGDLLTALRDVFGVTLQTETWQSHYEEENEPCEANAVLLTD